ncbi:MAG TPA: tetratricopeptide repeat protein [Pseudonocardiaceae bacterium]|nr:tetratricopeptide repeat protein [Pseudonocardiaceae bacterium]
MQIRLLGNVEIHGDAGIVPLKRSGERCVLATLALHARLPVTVGTLIDHLWLTTEQSDKSIDTVGTYVRNVRSAVKNAGGRPDSLRYDRNTRSYLLDIDPNCVDYHRFAALAATARQDRDPRACQEALSLWCGPALADVTGQWADNRRYTLESERLAAYDELLNHQLLAGRHAEVARTVAGLLDEVTPTDRLLLLGAKGLAGSGQHTAIRAMVARVTQRMHDTVGARPSGRVLDQIDQLITNPTTWSDPPATAPSAAMFSMRGDIPTFTGRHTELRGLLDAVASTVDGSVRAIAIHAVDGMAGVGKTAFGIHAAHHLADRFPDGNLFVELHGHTPGHAPVPPGEALGSLLLAAGMNPKAIPPKLDDRARLWRQHMAGKKILLVLDDAADHDQLRPLLPGTAGSLVLITSRRRLAALDGVRPLSLDVLPQAQAVHMLLRLADLDADRHDDAAVADIVEACGHLPLALALAGARLRSHPQWSARYLAYLLAHARDRLDHLRAGDRSVTAAFELSYQSLPVAQQWMFRLLGVHPGPEVDVFAVAALTNTSLREARQNLEALHADHLVQETAPGRYQPHDLLRAYANTLADDLDTKDKHDALDRVLNYYLHTAATASEQLPAYRTSTMPGTTAAPTDTPRMATETDVHAWFTAELATLTACVNQNRQWAVRIAAVLQPFLRVHGHTEQAVRIHKAAITAATDEHDHVGLANALTDLGITQRLRGEYEAATRSLTRANDLNTELNDRLGQAGTLAELGRVQYAQGEYETATRTLADAHELFATLDDRLGQAHTLTDLGRVQHARTEFDDATHTLTHAYDMFLALGHRLGQAHTLNDLGCVQCARNEYDLAAETHHRAHELYVALGDRLGQAHTLNDLGRMRYGRGEYEAAVQTLIRAHKLYSELGDRLGQANSLNSLGEVQCAQGEYEAAEHALTQARDLSIELGDRLGQANSLNTLGEVQCAQGEREAAEETLTRAHTLYTELGNRRGQADALNTLGHMRCTQGEYEAAIHTLTEARTLYTELGVRDGEAGTLNNLGDVALDYADAGDPDTYYGQALTIAEAIGSTTHKAHALAGQGQCQLRAANIDNAATLLRKAQSIYRSLGAPQAVWIAETLATLANRADTDLKK